MKKIVLLNLLLSFLFLGTAFASQYEYATGALWTGVDVDGSTRSDIDNALGNPDDKFLSLGLGGVATFDFGISFNATAIVFETTFGRTGEPDYYPEFAEIYVGNAYSLDWDNTDIFTLIGTIQNNLEQNIIDLSGIDGSPFRYVLIRDVTLENNGVNGDGFDVNAVGVAPVPEPATMMLFGIGLLGLAGVSRRKK